MPPKGTEKWKKVKVMEAENPNTAAKPAPCQSPVPDVTPPASSVPKPKRRRKQRLTVPPKGTEKAKKLQNKVFIVQKLPVK